MDKYVTRKKLSQDISQNFAGSEREVNLEMSTNLNYDNGRYTAKRLNSSAEGEQRVHRFSKYSSVQRCFSM